MTKKSRVTKQKFYQGAYLTVATTKANADKEAVKVQKREPDILITVAKPVGQKEFRRVYKRTIGNKASLPPLTPRRGRLTR